MAELNPANIAQSRLTVISYNLHGLNQGRPGIRDLMNTVAPDVFLIQEHWLTPNNLNKLNDVSDDYFVFGSSAMNETICTGPLYGRPFGGTAIMVNKRLAACCTNLVSSDRCTSLIVANWLFVTVYLPCVGTSQREFIVDEVLSEISALLDAHPGYDYIIGGDLNTDLDNNSRTSLTVNEFIRVRNLYRCDAFLPVGNKCTYINESTHASSAIDYMLTSSRDLIYAFNVLDPDINLSDHVPLLVVCACAFSGNAAAVTLPYKQNAESDVLYLRWDHAPVELYYEQTRLMLEPVLADLVNVTDHIRDCDVDIGYVDNVYNTVVRSLVDCAKQFIPRHRKNYYKFWWSQELDVLKQAAITSCRAWKSAGKPRNGHIHSKYIQDKILYKKRIKEEQANETSCFTNDLHDALMSKSGENFWKIWKCKFENKSSNVIHVDGIVDGAIIVNNFAKHFEACCKPFSDKRNEDLKFKYAKRRAEYIGDPLFDKPFDVELLDNLISNLKNGKAAGLDEITAEHLKHSHPILTLILAKLFNLFVSTGHIPNNFGQSYTVPIPKCDSRCRSLSVDDFRGISISPIISKLFEMSILNRFSSYFVTSDHQFGFKKNNGCSHAIFAVRNVIENFISNGSTVNVCALDLSKAFDRMNHYALFIKLMERNFPINMLTIIETWFLISTTCVKWQGHVSHFIVLLVGVRQGGALSPILFAIFIDSIVDRVKSINVGCYISSVCCSIFLYADDILLLCPTVTGLQTLLSICEKELSELDMVINVKKSTCVRFGARFNEQCEELKTCNGGFIQWTNSCRYLGVYFSSGRSLRCCLHDAKSRFYRAFNSIFGKVGRFASESVVINLLRTKCMPILLYAMEACPLLSRQKHSLQFSLTRIFMKLFSTGNSVIVKECQYYFNFLSVDDQLNIRTARFLQKFTASENILCSLFAKVASEQRTAIFVKYNTSIETACQLNNYIYEHLQPC